MAAPMPDHLAPIGSGEEADADPPPAAGDSDAPEPVEEEASQPPPIPVFTEAQACELVEHPTTDSLKVSWAEVVQTGIDGSVPEGVNLPACSLNYELALREVRPHHPVDIAGHQQYNSPHPDSGRALLLAVHEMQAHRCTVYAAMACRCCLTSVFSNNVATAAMNPPDARRPGDDRPAQRSCSRGERRVDLGVPRSPVRRPGAFCVALS